MAGTETIDKARTLLEERLAEIEDERKRLQRALSDLSGGNSRRGPGRPRGSTSSQPKRRRRRRGGTRAEQAIDHLSGNPGATASEVARAMGIKPNYVYRVMAELERDGLVRKQGKGYYAVRATSK